MNKFSNGQLGYEEVVLPEAMRNLSIFIFINVFVPYHETSLSNILKYKLIIIKIIKCKSMSINFNTIWQSEKNIIIIWGIVVENHRHV